MFERQKLLLRLIHQLKNHGIISRRAIVKSLFLLKLEYFIDNYIKFYSFYPYKQGPFSQVCFSDLRTLKNDGLIDEQETSLTPDGIKILNGLQSNFESQVHHLLGRFETEKELLNYVYSKYPQFTVKSQLIKRENPAGFMTGFCTIGYEGKNIDAFLNILIQNKVNIVVDVRNSPFSQNFCFIKNKLKKYLEEVDIGYIHIPELGIEKKDRTDLNSKEDYERLFAQYRGELVNKKTHLDRVIELGGETRIVLLCFEKDVSFCHRREIARHIRKNNHEVLDL